ncbi:MAG: hypothetical protein JWO62_270 [Acidimicrobiaceae bacterium]|nr:hypothetical protein [Acidimicrobiaceae bacterium]
MPDLPSAPKPESTGPDEVSGRTFPIVRRGFEPDAVRSFLGEIAGTLRDLRGREAELSSHEAELRGRLEDAERRAASPELDEETLSAAVGSETAKVLRAAHEAAREVLGRAEARAADVLAEAGTVLGERSREAEAEARAIAARSRAEAASIVDATKAECRTMVEEARDARRRILADLAERRRMLHVQLEQLRAGKDALAEVVEATARSVDEVRARLVGSEADARLAADRAAQVASFEHDDMSLEALVEESLALLGPPAPAADLDGSDGASSDAADKSAAADEPAVAYEHSVAVHEQPVAHDEPDAVPEGQDASPPAADAASEAPGVAMAETATAETAMTETAVAIVEPAELDGDLEPEDPAAPTGQLDPLESEPPIEPAEEEAGVEPPSVVDDLFARIRASRSGVGAGETAEEGDVAEAEAATPSTTGVEGESSQLHAAAGATVVVGSRPAAEDDDEADDAAGPGERLDEEQAVLARRDELLAPVLADLARVLKRELRSDQNELLDSLRNLQRGAEATELVPGEATTARLATATMPTLAAAWRAGIVFGSGGGEASGYDLGPEPGQVANELASEVVSSLHQRLEGTLSSVEEDGATAELVGAAYRQWRGDRVEDLVAHYATRSFSIGVLSGVGEGALVRWVVDDGKDHCPDCDDNALAGPQRVGEAFPTGQAHPPVHPGCRCTLVPIDS